MYLVAWLGGDVLEMRRGGEAGMEKKLLIGDGERCCLTPRVFRGGVGGDAVELSGGGAVRG